MKLIHLLQTSVTRATALWEDPARCRVQELGAAAPGVADRIEHQVTVTKAVRLFPDDPTYKWPLDGLMVKVVTFTDRDPNTLEVRYDTPDGRGSFWETLKRAVGTNPKTQIPKPKTENQPTPKK